VRCSDWLIWTPDWDQSWAVWSQFSVSTKDKSKKWNDSLTFVVSVNSVKLVTAIKVVARLFELLMAHCNRRVVSAPLYCCLRLYRRVLWCHYVFRLNFEGVLQRSCQIDLLENSVYNSRCRRLLAGAALIGAGGHDPPPPALFEAKGDGGT